jgi:hypothetical protein
MQVLTGGNTVYTRPVAKVMISIPDALLERLDARASSNGETRSGFLQRLAEAELSADEESRRRRVDALLEEIGTVDLGGEATRLIREDRESH